MNSSATEWYSASVMLAGVRTRSGVSASLAGRLSGVMPRRGVSVVKGREEVVGENVGRDIGSLAGPRAAIPTARVAWRALEADRAVLIRCWRAIMTLEIMRRIGCGVLAAVRGIRWCIYDLVNYVKDSPSNSNNNESVVVLTLAQCLDVALEGKFEV